jgi:hypothetical protein
MPDRMSQRMPDRMSEYMPDIMSEYVSESIGEDHWKKVFFNKPNIFFPPEVDKWETFLCVCKKHGFLILPVGFRLKLPIEPPQDLLVTYGYQSLGK